MIAGLALAALGVVAVVIALIEVLAVVFDSLRSTRSVIRRLSGRAVDGESDMEQAMQWVQVLGLLLIGGALVMAGIGIGGS